MEMARRLRAQGRRSESGTIIDTEPPPLVGGVARDVTEQQIRAEFSDAIRFSFDREDLPVDATFILSGSSADFSRHLRDVLVRAGLLPARSKADVLRGPLAAFAAARRTIYRPSERHAGKVRLVLVRNPSLDPDADAKRRQDYVEGWRCWVDDLEVWHGPGHHYSLLRAPHAGALAVWWQHGFASGAVDR